MTSLGHNEWTHWCWNEMASILQTFSNVFIWKKEKFLILIRISVNFILLLGVQSQVNIGSGNARDWPGPVHRRLIKSTLPKLTRIFSGRTGSTSFNLTSPGHPKTWHSLDNRIIRSDFSAWAQPMRDVVTKLCRVSLAGRKPRISHDNATRIRCQYNALSISRGMFSLKNSPHCSPERAKYGVFYLTSYSEQSFCFLPFALCSASCCIRPRYIESLVQGKIVRNKILSMRVQNLHKHLYQ